MSLYGAPDDLTMQTIVCPDYCLWMCRASAWDAWRNAKTGTFFNFRETDQEISGRVEVFAGDLGGKSRGSSNLHRPLGTRPPNSRSRCRRAPRPGSRKETVRNYCRGRVTLSLDEAGQWLPATDRTLVGASSKDDFGSRLAMHSGGTIFRLAGFNGAASISREVGDILPRAH